MNPFKALRKILKNQEEILRQLSFERGVRELRDHGAELPGEAAIYWHGKWSIDKMRLGELVYNSPRGTMPFAECPLAKFLARGEMRDFEEFRRDMVLSNGGNPLKTDESPEPFLQLARSLEEHPYDISRCAIVVAAPDNVVVDGNHRTSALIARHGPDHEISVIKLYTPNYGPWGIVKGVDGRAAD